MLVVVIEGSILGSRVWGLGLHGLGFRVWGFETLD